MPKGVALDWVTLITHSDSMLELTKKTGNHYKSIDKPMLMLSFSDDQMAPKRAVDELSNRVYKNALIKRMHIQADKIKPIIKKPLPQINVIAVLYLFISL